uniref:Eukaryotic translation initiation factor 4E family member 2 related sequence 1 n=1 Tax=Amphiprion ocellaris TaxID=80972 RepID=A0AAQ5XNM6_AMPOC
MDQLERPRDEEDQEDADCRHDNSDGINNNNNNNRRKTVCPAAGEHPLQYNYTFWYSRRTPTRPASSLSYEQNIRQIGTVASVEQFWRFYSHLVRPGDLSGHSDFHLFKEGIKPMWEDESNRSGGKWIIRLRKGLASRFWENIILAMLGEQFMVGEEICGAVVSIRFQSNISGPAFHWSMSSGPAFHWSMSSGPALHWSISSGPALHWFMSSGPDLH